MEEKKKKAIANESDYAEAERNAKKAMEESDTETVFVIPEGDNDSPMIVTINGVDHTVPKGVSVEVPKDVAAVVRNYQRQLAENKRNEKRNAARNSGIL